MGTGGDGAREGGQRVGRQRGGGLTPGQTPARGHSRTSPGHDRASPGPGPPPQRPLHLCPSATFPAPPPRLREAPRWSVPRGIQAVGLTPGSSPAQRAPHTTRTFTCTPTRARSHARTLCAGTHIPCVHTFMHVCNAHQHTCACRRGSHAYTAHTHTHPCVLTQCSHMHTHTHTHTHAGSSRPSIQGRGPQASVPGSEVPAAGSGALTHGGRRGRDGPSPVSVAPPRSSPRAPPTRLTG